MSTQSSAANLKDRLSVRYRRHGFWGLFLRILRYPIATAKLRWQIAFQNWEYVFRYDRSAPRVARPPAFSVRRYGSVEELPEELLSKLNDQYGDDVIKTSLIGVKYRGCVLWVAFLGTEAVCKTLSRPGKHIPRWFIPLEESDLVLFRVNTVPEHRGEGISPALTQHILAHELSEDASAYWDCKVYSHASIKAAEKSGFKLIAKMRPLPAEDWPEDL